MAFLPAAAVTSLIVAGRSVELPKFGGVEIDGIPFFRDAVNHGVYYVDEQSSGGGVYYLDSDDFEFFKLSTSLQGFLERLVAMHEENAKAGRIVCPGDFRCLNELEKRISAHVELTSER